VPQRVGKAQRIHHALGRALHNWSATSNLEVGCAKTVPNVIDSREKRKLGLVFPTPMFGFSIVVMAYQRPIEQLISWIVIDSEDSMEADIARCDKK